MKVLNILGSPRKNGTSARIAQSFTDTAESLGGKVSTFYLNGMNYRGCQACESCHSTANSCVVKDEATAILDEMRNAEIAIFSSPVYLGDVSGQLKIFLDRTWSQMEVNYENEYPFTSRLPPQKTALFILCQADTKNKHIDIINRYSEVFQLYGYQLEVIRATGLNGSAAEDVSSAQDQAITLARKLLRS